MHQGKDTKTSDRNTKSGREPKKKGLGAKTDWLAVRQPQCHSLTFGTHFLIPSGSDVRGVLPDGHVITSRHAGWGGAGWVDLPCPLQSVCQRHALALLPRRVSPLRERHSLHSRVPQAHAARQLP